MNQTNFRPLLEGLTIRKSKIDGLGLFVTRKFAKDSILGITHVYKDSDLFHNKLIRTALGAFINHSCAPNAKLITTDKKYYWLILTEKVKYGEEITLNYNKTPCGYNQSCAQN